MISNMTTNYSLDALEPTDNATYTKLFPDGLILAYNIFLSTAIAFGVPGNFIVLIVFSKLKVSSTTDVFIIFITIFDFLSSSANVPVYLTFTNGAWKNYGTNFLCKTHMYLSQIVVLTSVLLTGELAIERYLIICRPHGATISVKMAQCICMITCVMAALISIPMIQVYQNDTGACLSGKLSIAECIYFISVFLMYIIVFIAIVVCYTKICFTIKRSQAVIEAHRKRAGYVRTRRSKVSFIRVKFNQVTPVDRDVTPTTHNAFTEHDSIKNNENKESSLIHGSKENETMKTSTENKQGEQTSTDSYSQAANAVQYHTIRFKNTPAFEKQNESKSLILRQKVRTTKIAFLVCSIFIISWLIPLSCFVLLQVLTINSTLMKFVLFGKMMYLVNTFSNPFLYAWLNKKFRLKLKDFFRFCK